MPPILRIDECSAESVPDSNRDLNSPSVPDFAAFGLDRRPEVAETDFTLRVNATTWSNPLAIRVEDDVQTATATASLKNGMSEFLNVIENDPAIQNPNLDTNRNHKETRTMKKSDLFLIALFGLAIADFAIHGSAAVPGILFGMAIIRTGGIVGQISGSIAGVTYSHNKGGAYIRNRSIPTNPSSTTQLQRRADLATVSTDWQNLTAADRAAWTEWARQNPITNALGDSILKSGHQAFVGLNSRILLGSGTIITVPPVVARPDGFLTLVQDGDIGAGDTDLTFTAALVSGNQVELWAAVTDSAGIRYVENLYKFITFSPVDQSSPWDNESDIISVLGSLIVGQTLHVKAAQYDPANGQRSTFVRSDVVVSSSV